MTNHYRIIKGANATDNGKELIATLERIADNFSRVKRLFDAMTQARDGAAGNATDYVTPAELFGFADATLTVNSTVAMNAYNELNAFIGNAGPSLEQAVARFKQ